MHFLQICLLLVTIHNAQPMTFQDDILIEKACNLFSSQLACSTLNLLGNRVASFLLLVRCTERVPKETVLVFPVWTVAGWVLWRMKGQAVLLCPHLILDITSTAERWDSKQCITNIIVVTSGCGPSCVPSAFQGFLRLEKRKSLCDFIILSMWSNQQWVPLRRWVLPIRKVRGNIRSQDFQSSGPSLTAETKKFKGMKLGNQEREVIPLVMSTPVVMRSYFKWHWQCDFTNAIRHSAREPFIFFGITIRCTDTCITLSGLFFYGFANTAAKEKHFKVGIGKI